MSKSDTFEFYRPTVIVSMVGTALRPPSALEAKLLQRLDLWAPHERDVAKVSFSGYNCRFLPLS